MNIQMFCIGIQESLHHKDTKGTKETYCLVLCALCVFVVKSNIHKFADAIHGFDGLMARAAVFF
jgi:hypothetical protein